MPLSRSWLGPGLVAAQLASGPCAADEPTKQVCVAANETAQDLQRGGKFVDAREQLRICAASGCPQAVREDCAERLESVEHSLATVVLTPRGLPSGSDVTASLAVDGVARPEALDGTPVAMDPGTHTLTVRVPREPPVSLRVSLKEGEHLSRDVVFKTVPATPAQRAGQNDSAASAEEAALPASASGEVASDGRAKRLRWVGWSAAGAGVAGVALGSVFGVRAMGNKSSLSSACSGSACPAAAQPDIDGLHANAIASDICFAVGLLGLGAGAALLVLLPDTTPADGAPARSSAFRARPWIGPQDVGISGIFR